MDRISRLPDEVICHILSFLPTKHAVATSVLSSRWVNLWTLLSVIDLDDSLYLNPERKDSSSELFISFLERVLSMNRSETIVKFRLYMHSPCGETLSGISRLIQKAFSRNVVQVDLGIFSVLAHDANYEDQCLKIPHSQSLKLLKVTTEYRLKMPVFPGCFPSLGVFDAKFSVDYHDELLENLFPCLPALEKLCLVVDFAGCCEDICVNVGGPALKHLDLQLLIYEYEQCDAMVVIDAPKLDYLRLQDTFLASYLVKHKLAISEVRLHVGDDEELLEILDEEGDPTRITRFDELLHGLVNTKFMSVSASTLMVILPQKWNLPVLPYLTKLELDVPASCWLLLLHWLESCPNLKVLSLIIMEEVEELDEEEWMLPDVVPSCLSSCINEIEIKRLGKAIEEEMLKYLLDNAKVLDKFTVNSRV